MAVEVDKKGGGETKNERKERESKLHLKIEMNSRVEKLSEHDRWDWGERW